MDDIFYALLAGAFILGFFTRGVIKIVKYKRKLKDESVFYQVREKWIKKL